jgi:hypothetical protein
VLVENVDELHPRRITERLGDLGDPPGVVALDVGVHDQLTGRPPGARLVLGVSSRSTGIDLQISIELMNVIE